MRRFGPAVLVEAGEAVRKTCDNSLARESLADHARGKWKDFRRITTQLAGQCGTTGTRILDARLASASIDKTGIDEQSARHGFGEVLARHYDRRGAEAVLRKRGGCLGARRALNHHQIASVRFADTSSGGAQ